MILNDKRMQSVCVMCNKPIRFGGEKVCVLENIPVVELRKEMLESGIERTFYICPHCDFKYTVMLTDEETRELMKTRNKIKGYAKYKNAGVRLRKQEEYEKIDKEIKEKLNKLNGK